MHLNCFLVRMVHVNGSDLCATLKDFALWFHFNFAHFDLISTSDKNIDGGNFVKLTIAREQSDQCACERFYNYQEIYPRLLT